jgi:dTDP-4-amino-4,6-dideoxygalactose transaminase
MAKLAIGGGTPVRTEPFAEWPVFDDRERQALNRVLESRRWTSSPYVAQLPASQLEERFAAHNGTRYGIATGSGTDALQIGFAAAGVRAGDEVILAPNTFIAGATPILMLGAVPVFVDVEPECLNLDPDAVEAAITDRTRAISPLHLAGYPCDMDRINEIAAKHSLKVIADACHAHGSEWQGTRIGALADVSAFSFQQGKNMTAGEGGMAVTDDRHLYELCYMYHNDGRGMGDDIGTFGVMGWNFRMSGFQAAVLLVQLERLDELLDRKAQSVAYLKRGLSEIEGLRLPQEDTRATRLTYLYPRLVYDESAFGGIPAALFAQALSAEGIPCRGRSGHILYQHPLFTEQRFFFESSKRIDYTHVHCPVLEAARGTSIGFPQTVLLSDEGALDDFIEAINKVKDNLEELQHLAWPQSLSDWGGALRAASTLPSA